MEPLNKELERTLRRVHKLRGPSANKKMIESVCPYELLEPLVDGGYIRYADSDPDSHDYRVVDRIEETTKGRTYPSEKRRDRLRRWAPVIVAAIVSGVLGIIGTLAGTYLGWWLASH